MKTTLSLLLALCMAPLAFAEAPTNTKCPIMTDDDVEAEHSVEMGGVKIALCCGKCEKIWKKSDDSAKYYTKVALELGLLPQLKGKEVELGLDKITLLPQRFCPMNPKTLIAPDSVTVEYKGQKVYLFNERAKEKWNVNPDEAAKKAIEAGLLPQLKAA
jgi:hypothetical protein